MVIAKDSQMRGFSLAEILVATLVALIIIAGVVQIFKSSSDAGKTALLRADLQQNARGSLAIINRDLGEAAIGVPQAGIPLPAGGGVPPPGPRFACGGIPVTCPLGPNTTYTGNTLFPVNPSPGIGAATAAAPAGTDAITIAYIDSTWPLPANLPVTAIAAAGTNITVNPGDFDAAGNPVPPGTGRAYNDPVFGARVGDVLMLQNQNGSAVAVVTGVNAGGGIVMNPGDALNFNQSAAGVTGNVASLLPGNLPTVVRLQVITYFVQTVPPPPAAGVPTLMRQVNAQQAVPVAEGAQNLQFTYDFFNPGAVPPAPNYVAGVNGAGINNSLIRKVRTSLTLRSEVTTPQGGMRNFPSLTVSSSVSPRDLSFSDRFR
jgi:Tfp pilus assembly protein PilV